MHFLEMCKKKKIRNQRVTKPVSGAFSRRGEKKKKVRAQNADHPRTQAQRHHKDAPLRGAQHHSCRDKSTPKYACGRNQCARDATRSWQKKKRKRKQEI